MTILFGSGILALGVYLYVKDVWKDKVRIHKFNAIWKYQYYIFIYGLIIVGALTLIREFIRITFK